MVAMQMCPSLPGNVLMIRSIGQWVPKIMSSLVRTTSFGCISLEEIFHLENHCKLL